MRRLLGFVSILFCLFGVPDQSLADWSSDFAPPGPPGLTPRAMAWWNGSVVAAGSSPASSASIQAFDGEFWREVGDISGTVDALAVWQGRLVAAGSLEFGDGEHQYVKLATWDGSRWAPWPGENVPNVKTMSVRGGALYVGGSFQTCGEDTLNHIAVWRDGQWASLGGGVGQARGPEVRALAWHDGSLFVGGRFSLAGERPALCVARWDGDSWHSLGDGVFGAVNALQSYNGRLYAGGEFVDAGGDTIAGIASWDGERWHRVGDGLRPRGRSARIRVTHLVSWGDGLVATGDFQSNDAGIEKLAMWDGSEWSSFAGAERINEGPTILWSHNGRLFLGSRRPLECVPEESNLVAWDGASWSRVGGGARKVDPYRADIRGRDEFLRRTGTPLLTDEMKARASEKNWPRIRLVTVWRDDIVAFVGRSRHSNSHPAMVVAWRGGDWETLAEFPYGSSARAEEILPTGDQLVFLGTFKGSKDSPMVDACAWDGSSWTDLGTERRGWRRAAATVWRGTAVVAMDTVSRRRTIRDDCVLVLDGLRWRQLDVAWEQVNALCEWESKLIAAVRAESEADRGYVRLSSWDGTESKPIPGRFQGSVNGMVPYDGTLVATGFFTAVDSLLCEKIAYLDGDVWLPMDGGLEGLPQSIAAVPGQLWIGGRTKKAGALPSAPVARWDGPLPRDVDLAAIPRVEPPPKPKSETTKSVVDGWHSHGINSYEPAGAFENGDLSDWDDAGPVGWSVRSRSRHGREVIEHPVHRLEGGGIRLTLPDTEGWLVLSRRIAAESGKAYRARFRLRVADPYDSGETKEAFVSLSDYIRRDSKHEYGPIHGGIGVTVTDTSWTWAEATLVTEEGANVCVVRVESRSRPMTIEVAEVEFTEVEVSSEDVVEELLTHLERRYVHSGDGEIDWDGIRQEFIEKAASTPVTESDKLVGGILSRLAPAGVACASLESDMHNFSAYGSVSGRPDSTHSQDGKRIRRTRDDLASSMVFSSELGDRSRDGLMLLRTTENLSRVNWDGVKGVLLDLRSTTGNGLSDRYGSRDWSRKVPWEGLRTWSRRSVPFAVKHGRLLERTVVDTLKTPTPASSGRSPSLVVLIDQTTVGPAALTAMAADAMGAGTIVGLPAGEPFWRSSWVPLACGVQAHFPATEIFWPDGVAVRDGNTLQPHVVVPDSTETRDGVDPILEVGLETLRSLVANDS